MVDDIMVRSRFVRALGADLEEKTPGSSRMSLLLTDDHAGSDGRAHGGVITTLLDSALAIALRDMRGEGASRHSSVEMNTSFLSAAMPGDRVTVCAEIVQLGQAVAFGEAEARRDDGELVAKARVTFAIQQARPGG
jgi:acyl-CoA thioesterase